MGHPPDMEVVVLLCKRVQLLLQYDVLLAGVSKDERHAGGVLLVIQDAVHHLEGNPRAVNDKVQSDKG